MIIDNIKNAEKYVKLHPSFKAAFEALFEITPETPDEKITVDGDNIFVNLATYTNKNVDECLFESHKKYIDIQYVITGGELIDVCEADNLKATDDRLDTDDIAFYENTDVFSTAYLGGGDFVILFPGEAHRPCVAPDGKGIKTKKAVAKIICR